MKTRSTNGLAALAALCLLLGGCARNPATGQLQWNVLSLEQEIALGEEAKDELAAGYGGAVEDADLQRYVTEIGERMTRHTEGDYPDLPWEFTLLDSDVINAFALPGGKVFITRGLASNLENEAEMAGVLGHEIAHVTAGHIDQRVGNQIAIAIGLTALSAVAASTSDDDLIRYGVPTLVGAGSGLFLLQFGRDDELQADRLGMRYMSKAGYHPRAQRRVMEALLEASQGSRPPELLSTHPYPERRMSRIDRILETQYAWADEPDADLGMFEDRYQREFLTRLDRYAARRDRDVAFEQERARLAEQYGAAFTELLRTMEAAGPMAGCPHCLGALLQLETGPQE